MQAYQERVVDEYKELRSKRERLGLFLAKPPVPVPSDELDRMRRQFNIMVEYEGVLQERIDRFK